MNLHDTTLLITRPEAAARRFAAQAEAWLGPFARVVISPLLEIRLRDIDLSLEDGAELAFTSENGVAAVEGGAGLAGRRAWCVGDRTANRARRAGFDVIQAGGDVETLAAAIVAGNAPSVLHVSGAFQQGDLVGALTSSGINANRIVAYDQIATPLTSDANNLLSRTGDVIAPVFSPRTGRLLVDASAGRKARLHVVAISENAMPAWVAAPKEHVVVASEPTANAMIAAMGSLFDADSAS